MKVSKIANRYFAVLPCVTVLIVAIGFISSCGSSGSGEECTSNCPNPGISPIKPDAIITYLPDAPVPGDILELDGSASFDPQGGEISKFVWSQLDGSPVALSSPNEAKTSFIVPNETTTIKIQLIVTNDNNVASDPATVEIPIVSVGPLPSENITAIFVSSSTGSDAPTQSGSFLHPVATIKKGIALAVMRGLSTVYVMEGSYEEAPILRNNIKIKGCVTSVDSNGVPSFSTDNSKTVIKAPAGAGYAIVGNSVGSVSLECFNIEGASSGTGSSAGILINGAQSVKLANLAVETPGAANDFCRDIEIKNSKQVAITASSFINSGRCHDYIAVSVNESENVTISAEKDSNKFVINTGGNEKYLTAIYMVDDDFVEVSTSSVQGDGGRLSQDAVFTGMVISDATGVVIRDNLINVDGGLEPAGVVLRCADIALDAANIMRNMMFLTNASSSASGLSIVCSQPAGIFSVRQNQIELTPLSANQAKLNGVEIESMQRPMALNLVNNVVSMPAVSNDLAAKTGVYFMDAAHDSVINSVHNTFLQTGKGELHYLYSDSPDTQFSTINDIVFLYGAHPSNAALSLLSQCDAANCAKTIVGNLINKDMFGYELPLAYYFDTAQFVSLDIANECEQPLPPARCSGEVDRKGNYLPLDMTPDYFDFDTGMLQQLHQNLAKDLGSNQAGVTIDIKEKDRSDGHPDIGAYEY